MAIYAGETVRVYAQGEDWDDTPLSPVQADVVQLVVIDNTGVVVEASPMDWITEESRWRYDWDSPPVAGSYSIEVSFNTETGTSIDVRRVNLAEPRVVSVFPPQPIVIRV
jgi:hypothetical protein